MPVGCAELVELEGGVGPPEAEVMFPTLEVTLPGGDELVMFTDKSGTDELPAMVDWVGVGPEKL